jgi:S-adenosylmethionine hydrolase
MYVRILHQGKEVYTGEMPYTSTFGAVAVGQPLAYLNSLLQLSFALNQGDFAAVNKIGSGGEWQVEVRKR